MIKFKGRCSVKQYIPLKPIKRGYKVWVRADENGYVCQFEIYTKKGKEKGMGLGESVVEKLCKPISNKSYKIFADNFFSSVHLAYCLKKNQIGYCGTIRLTRKNIPNMKNEKIMKRGEIDWRMEENGLSITKWMDNKVVYFISNMHNPEKSESVSRKNKDGTEVVIGGNQVNKDYNKHMGYVDKADMLKSLYGLDCKSKKWWHRIAFHFLDVAIVNSYIIFKNIHGAKLPLKTFKLNVIHYMLGAAAFKQTKSRKSSETVLGSAIKRSKTTIAPGI